MSLGTGSWPSHVHVQVHVSSGKPGKRGLIAWPGEHVRPVSALHVALDNLGWASQGRLSAATVTQMMDPMDLAPHGQAAGMSPAGRATTAAWFGALLGALEGQEASLTDERLLDLGGRTWVEVNKGLSKLALLVPGAEHVLPDAPAMRQSLPRPEKKGRAEDARPEVGGCCDFFRVL